MTLTMAMNLSIQNDCAFLTHFPQLNKKTSVFPFWGFFVPGNCLFFFQKKISHFLGFLLHPFNAPSTCIVVECCCYFFMHAFLSSRVLVPQEEPGWGDERQQRLAVGQPRRYTPQGHDHGRGQQRRRPATTAATTNASSS